MLFFYMSFPFVRETKLKMIGVLNMKTIVIWSRKGGVGKTATAHALGAALMKKGAKVLFIDCDGQCNLSLALKAEEDNNSMFEVLNGAIKINQAIQKNECGDICGASELLQTINEELEPDFLIKELREISNIYDYCVIDTPAALGMITINCLIAANEIIIPVEADLFSMQGIPRILEALQTIKRNYYTKAHISGFLVTRYNGHTNLSRQNLESLKQIAESQGTKVFNTPIRECIAVKEAKQEQKDIFTYAPRCNAAIDYSEFINEFLQEI